MTFSDIKKHFADMNYREIKEALGLSSTSQLTHFKNHGISKQMQAYIQIKTNGDLKADIEPIKKEQQ